MTIVTLWLAVRAGYKFRMPFWTFQRGALAEQVSADPGAMLEIALEPVALFGIGRVMEGFVDPLGRRMTELLNDGTELRATVADEAGLSGWRRFPLDELIAVAPPPHPPNPTQRISRRRHRIVLRAAPYRILGTAHLAPGADVDAFIARSAQRWLPVTDCTITTTEAEYDVDVAIVNLAHVSAVERLLVAM